MKGDVALLSVSSTISGADFLLKDEVDISINICGGWHHAFEDKGRGFCIFNDVGVVAKYLLTKDIIVCEKTKRINSSAGIWAEVELFLCL